LQTYDAWVLKWEPPFDNIYRLYATPPGPGRLLSFGFDRLLDAVIQQFGRLGQDLAGGRFAEVPLLMLAGLAVALADERLRRLLGALAAASVPYLLFVLVYWHYEDRYVTYIIPWLSLLVVGGIGRLLALARLAGPAQYWSASGLIVCLLLLVVPARTTQLVGKAERLTETHGDVIIAQWLAEATPADAVVMTRQPWQMSWHSQRLTVMVPAGSLEDILTVARRYRVSYLQLDHLTDRNYRREAIAPLYEGREALGFTKVQEFRNPRGVLYGVVYRLPMPERGGP
jgi:hypothetical protein